MKIREGFMDFSYSEMNDLERDELLRRAKVGITALVDEATKYQSVRPDNDLLTNYSNLVTSHDSE